ncbi:MAG TPA: cobalamin-binding protein [Dongiaceae bacterium]|nr:cobalamin-binding protein [Dongiaceae bacterium]
MSSAGLKFARSVFCVAGFLLFVSRNSAQSNVLNASGAAHEVTDDVGRSVRVPSDPQRVVSLAPSVTETIYALGDDSRLVGDTDYCDYPPDAQKKTKVGGAIDPSLEQIAALRPDLVLVAKSANRLDTVRALESLGIPSYATDAHSVDDIIASTQRLADVLDVPAAGKTLADDLHKRLAELQLQLANAAVRRVLFVVWLDPLISVSQKTFIADAIRHAGAISIVESTQEWPQISLEQVLHLQPEYLVFATSHTGEGKRDFDALVQKPGWRNLEAVRNNHLAIVSDAINRPSPRIVSVIEDLARQLHPEVFKTPANVPSLPNPTPKPISSQSFDSIKPETACAL